MVAPNTMKTALVVLLGLSLSCSSGSQTAENEALVSYLTREVAHSLTLLGKRIEECDEISASKAAIVLDGARLAQLGAGPEEILLAIGYFDHMNGFRCERDERLNLVYNLSALASAKRQMGLSADEDSSDYEELVLPPLGVYDYILRYSALPSPLQNYFSEAFGEEPFDLSAVLDANAALLSP